MNLEHLFVTCSLKFTREQKDLSVHVHYQCSLISLFEARQGPDAPSNHVMYSRDMFAQTHIVRKMQAVIWYRICSVHIPYVFKPQTMAV